MPTKTIKVKPPTKAEVKDAAKELRKGHPAGAKVMNDQKTAKAAKKKSG